MPAIFSSDCNFRASEELRKIISLPCRLGGLAIPNIVEEFRFGYHFAGEADATIMNQLRDGDFRDPRFVYNKYEHFKSREKAKQEKMKRVQSNLQRIIEKLKGRPKEKNSEILLKLLAAFSQNGASAWLSVPAIAKFNFILNCIQFRDMLCVRYNIPIPDLPKKCACGLINDLQHASVCKKGGFQIGHHDHTVAIWTDLLSASGARDIRREVQVNIDAGSARNYDSPLQQRSDISAVDGNGNHTHFDITNISTIAASHLWKESKSVYKNAENQKEQKYQLVRDGLKQNLIPLVHNGITGLPQLKAQKLFKELVSVIAHKTDQHQSDVTLSYRIQFSFAAVRNMSLKLRGNKVKPRKPLQLSHTHTYTETLIAWKVRNFGGDFWSDGVEEIGL